VTHADDELDGPAEGAEWEWQDDPDERERLERMGWWSAVLGVGAMFLGMVMGCTYYTSLPLAIATGVAAMWTANGVISREFAGTGRAYANVGMWSGAVATIFSALILLLCGTFIALYALLIGGALLLGN